MDSHKETALPLDCSTRTRNVSGRQVRRGSNCDSVQEPDLLGVICASRRSRRRGDRRFIRQARSADRGKSFEQCGQVVFCVSFSERKQIPGAGFWREAPSVGVGRLGDRHKRAKQLPDGVQRGWWHYRAERLVAKSLMSKMWCWPGGQAASDERVTLTAAESTLVDGVLPGACCAVRSRQGRGLPHPGGRSSKCGFDQAATPSAAPVAFHRGTAAAARSAGR